MNANFDLLKKYQDALNKNLDKEETSKWKYETQERIVNSIFADTNSSCAEKFHILDTFYSTQIVQHNHKKFDVVQKIINGFGEVNQDKFQNQDFGVIKKIADSNRGKSKNARGILSFATKYSFHQARGLGILDKENKYVILDSKVLETLKKIDYDNPQGEFYNVENYQKYCDLIGKIAEKMQLQTKRECELLLWKISKYSITL